MANKTEGIGKSLLFGLAAEFVVEIIFRFLKPTLPGLPAITLKTPEIKRREE